MRNRRQRNADVKLIAVATIGVLLAGFVIFAGLYVAATSGDKVTCGRLPIGDADKIDDVGRFLFARGIYVTLAAFPLVPRHEVGFRVQVTAANTHEDIDLLLSVLGEANDRFELAGAWHRAPAVPHAG